MTQALNFAQCRNAILDADNSNFSFIQDDILIIKAQNTVLQIFEHLKVSCVLKMAKYH